MSTNLPAIRSPRGNAASGSNGAKLGGGLQDQSRNAGHDAGWSHTNLSSIKDWTPHDVAEWLYMQETKGDYTHVFLVHNIDGPALLGLTADQLKDWKVKPADVNTVMKGVQDLKRITEGQLGWQPNSDEPVHLPKAPTTEPSKQPPPRRKPKAKPAAPAPKVDEAASAPAEDVQQQTFSLTAVPDQAQSPRGAKTRRAESGQASMASLDASSKAKNTSPTYLRKVMSELHHSDRVPLWKEEMVERVKRAATARQAAQQVDAPVSVSAPPSSRLPGGLSRRRLTVDDDAASAVSGAAGSPQPGGGTKGGGHTGRGPESVADSLAESGTQLHSAQAKEIERKLFWYQDAIHEQELQQQLLDQKIRALQEEATAAHDRLVNNPVLRGVGMADVDKEMARRQMREKNKLSRNLQVTEERVAGAERLNKATVESINKLRRGRADFLRIAAKLEDRVAAMAADMKHFSQSAHSSLDEKEKVESRLKRQKFDYTNEVIHADHLFDMLQHDLQALEEKIAQAHAEHEKFLQAQRQNAFRDVRQRRDDDQKRELRLGSLQNLVRSQEMDFQRLHRIMGVKFTPEKPESVQDIVKASLDHERRNQSLLQYVGVQNQQLEELADEVKHLEVEEEKLTAEQQRSTQRAMGKEATAHQSSSSALAIERGIEKRDADLSKLSPLVLSIASMIGCSAEMESDGGLLALKGCRPDTLADFLRLIDTQVKELRQRAEALPTAAGNEWLRDFLKPKEVRVHPNVVELRKELEAAAQKQKEAQEAKRMMQPTSGADDTTVSLPSPDMVGGVTGDLPPVS